MAGRGPAQQVTDSDRMPWPARPVQAHPPGQLSGSAASLHWQPERVPPLFVMAGCAFAFNSLWGGAGGSQWRPAGWAWADVVLVDRDRLSGRAEIMMSL